MATVVNAALALSAQSYSNLLAGDIDEILNQYRNPYCNVWTNEDFAAATRRVVVKRFERGVANIPKLTLVLRRMSVAVSELRNALQQKKKSAAGRTRTVPSAVAGRTRVKSIAS